MFRYVKAIIWHSFFSLIPKTLETKITFFCDSVGDVLHSRALLQRSDFKWIQTLWHFKKPQFSLCHILSAPCRAILQNIKMENLVFIRRVLWAAWELERPHPLFLEASRCPLWGSDWSSKSARSWNSEFKNTSFWCHQAWWDWGSQRGTKGELHYFTNDYLSCVRYVFLSVSPPCKYWTELNFACSSCGVIVVRDAQWAETSSNIHQWHRYWGRLKACIS